MKELEDYIQNPNVAYFVTLRNAVITHKSYNPHSNDIEVLNDLYSQQDYEAVAAYESVNILLSPMAHLIKSAAYEKLDNHNAAATERTLWHLMLKGLTQMGDGSAQRPFIIARSSDQIDLLDYKNEEALGKKQVSKNGRHYEIVATVAGSEYHFDITECYKKTTPIAPEPMPVQEVNNPIEEDYSEEEPKKKWWKFW